MRNNPFFHLIKYPFDDGDIDEAHVPAEQQEEKEQAWVPRTHENEERPKGSGEP